MTAFKPKISPKGVAVTAFCILLPLLAWFIGAQVNPSGYESDSPVSVFYFIFALAAVYWPLTLAALVVLIILAKQFPKQFGAIFPAVAIIASIALSMFIYHDVSTAREQELSD